MRWAKAVVALLVAMLQLAPAMGDATTSSGALTLQDVRLITVSEFVSQAAVATPLGVRIHDQRHTVAEFQYNSFLPADLNTGWGFGLQYVMKFE